MNRTLNALAAVLAAVTTGCAADAVVPAPLGHPYLEIGRDTTLLVDETVKVSLLAVDATNHMIPSPTITWQSSAPSIASVDGAGRVTAGAPGTATVTARMDTIGVKTTITVVPQFTLLAPGEAHTCGISGRAEVYCWGVSLRGELGPAASLQDCSARFGPGTRCSAQPVRSYNVRAIQVVTGETFTCALDDGGSASCWGSNYYGEGGAGSSANTLELTQVAGGYQFTQLVAGRRHVCGITTAKDAYCWGWDYTGALGAGDVSTDRCQGDPCSRVPRLVTGGHQWAQLSATDRATCGVTTANELYCWGLDIGGGDGLYCQVASNLAGCTHTPILIASSQGHKSIGIGEVHRCAQELDGSLDCWGANYYGMLGNGSRSPSTTPAPVLGGASFTSFVAGRGSNCALTSDGRAQCWGSNYSGQIGDGSGQDALVPTDVSGGHRFTALFSSGSADGACGLDDKTHAYCWGYGVFGQLGDGAFNSHGDPVLVQMGGTTP